MRELELKLALSLLEVHEDIHAREPDTDYWKGYRACIEDLRPKFATIFDASLDAESNSSVIPNSSTTQLVEALKEIEKVLNIQGIESIPAVRLALEIVYTALDAAAAESNSPNAHVHAVNTMSEPVQNPAGNEHESNSPVIPESSDVSVLEALRNCYALGRRMDHRQDTDPEWAHIVRFCESAGLKSNPLRSGEPQSPSLGEREALRNIETALLEFGGLAGKLSNRLVGVIVPEQKWLEEEILALYDDFKASEASLRQQVAKFRAAFSNQAKEQPSSTGVSLIQAERLRQVNAEGWTPEHDAEHRHGELALAAACYAVPPDKRSGAIPSSYWPWAGKWWKPSPNDRLRELAKAGALIAAEIDRLTQSVPSTSEPQEQSACRGCGAGHGEPHHPGCQVEPQEQSEGKTDGPRCKNCHGTGAAYYKNWKRVKCAFCNGTGIGKQSEGERRVAYQSTFPPMDVDALIPGCS